MVREHRRLRLAGVVLAVAAGLRALAQLQPAALLPDLLYYGAVAVVVCGVVLLLLGAAARWMRPQDAAWLLQQQARWAWPVLVAAGLALLLALDMLGSAWARTPQLREVAVVRGDCTRISSGKVKSTIQSDAADGQWCFQPAGARVGDGRYWRVDIDQVRPARSMGQAGRLQLRVYPSWLFGADAYTRVQGVV